MSHHRNSDIDKALRGVRNLAAAFDLYRRRSALLNQPAGVAHRFFHAELKREERHVGHNQGPLGTPAHRPRVMNHHVEGDGKRVVVAQDNHPQRVPHENDIHAGAVQKPRHREIISSPYGDLFAAFLHRPQIGHAYWFHKN